MQPIDWLQLGVFLLIIVLFTKPLGLYLKRVLAPEERTFLDLVFKPVERLIYKACCIDPLAEQDWKTYLACIMGFSLVSLMFTGAFLALQYYLPLNLGCDKLDVTPSKSHHFSQ